MEFRDEESTRSRSVWVAKTVIVLLLASLLGGIAAYVTPKKYESSAVIELLPPPRLKWRN
jgi:hypothetical protein